MEDFLKRRHAYRLHDRPDPTRRRATQRRGQHNVRNAIATPRSGAAPQWREMSRPTRGPVGSGRSRWSSAKPCGSGRSGWPAVEPCGPGRAGVARRFGRGPGASREVRPPWRRGRRQCGRRRCGGERRQRTVIARMRAIAVTAAMAVVGSVRIVVMDSVNIARCIVLMGYVSNPGPGLRVSMGVMRVSAGQRRRRNAVHIADLRNGPALKARRRARHERHGRRLEHESAGRYPEGCAREAGTLSHVPIVRRGASAPVSPGRQRSSTRNVGLSLQPAAGRSWVRSCRSIRRTRSRRRRRCCAPAPGRGSRWSDRRRHANRHRRGRDLPANPAMRSRCGRHLQG